MDETDILAAASSEEVTETVEIMEEPERPFLSTPLDEYTVTEGLLLLIVLILFFGKIGQALKEGFFWLL